MSTKNTVLDNPTSSTSDGSMPCGDIPAATPQHAWLRRFAGEWDGDLEMLVEPGKPLQKTRCVESAHMVGDFWLVTEAHNLDFPFQCHLALGYDAAKGKYLGTWADSMGPSPLEYSGAPDPAGKTLTLYTEAPFPPAGGKLMRFRSVNEFKSDDHRIFHHSVQLESGEWQTCLTIQYRRRR